MGCAIDRQAEEVADVTDNLTDQCIEKATASENSNSWHTLGFLSLEKDHVLYGDITCLALSPNTTSPPHSQTFQWHIQIS